MVLGPQQQPLYLGIGGPFRDFHAGEIHYLKEEQLSEAKLERKRSELHLQIWPLT